MSQRWASRCSVADCQREVVAYVREVALCAFHFNQLGRRLGALDTIVGGFTGNVLDLLNDVDAALGASLTREATT